MNSLFKNVCPEMASNNVRVCVRVRASSAQYKLDYPQG